MCWYEAFKVSQPSFSHNKNDAEDKKALLTTMRAIRPFHIQRLEKCGGFEETVTILDNYVQCHPSDPIGRPTPTFVI